MNIYEQSLRIVSTQVDAHRQLRPSTLFALFQEAAIAHTEELGMGRHKTLDRGLLWALTMQRVQVIRMPEYDEKVTLTSWPGETMHVLFPRYYALTGEDGVTLVRASSLWALIDRDSRKIIFPEKFGILIHGTNHREQCALPSPLRLERPTGEGSYIVPYSAIDLNGHMNNAKYLDLAQDRMPQTLRDQSLREVEIEYINEARLGTRIELKERVETNRYALWGEAESKRLFRLSMSFGDNAVCP